MKDRSRSGKGKKLRGRIQQKEIHGETVERKVHIHTSLTETQYFYLNFHLFNLFITDISDVFFFCHTSLFAISLNCIIKGKRT